ncbi:MAG: hypothetical protein CMO47_02000 [Verrucomicrobiales bacterium]|nr:hypothetical protein [Verrucomicrobiales bacterium]
MFEHDSQESFYKVLRCNDPHAYLCGGRKMERRRPKYSNSIIYMLNRSDFSPIRTFESEAIKGAIVRSSVT